MRKPAVRVLLPQFQLIWGYCIRWPDHVVDAVGLVLGVWLLDGYDSDGCECVGRFCGFEYHYRKQREAGLCDL